VTLTDAARRHASFDSFVRPPSRAAALEFVSHHLELLDSRRQRGLALILELLRLGESGETSTD
jgi:endonuclease/exonuclease/phosphatase family metal-dependent hydrolase